MFAGRLLSPKPAGVAVDTAGNFRFGTPPACRNFCLRQAGSVAASRVMPSFHRPPRFAEGISVLRGNKVFALYIAALCRRIAKPLKPRCSGGGLFTGSWVFAGCLLSPKSAGVAAGATGNFRFGAPPACRNFCLHQADSVAASRVMPPFPRPPRFAEGIFRRWRIRKGREKRHIYPRATVSRFSSRASNTRAACCTRSGSFLPAEIAVPSACAIGDFLRKISHALATQRTLCVRTDVHFPSNIGAKGSRREESRIFFKISKRRRSTCGTFGNCPFPYRLPTAIPARLFQQAGVFWTHRLCVAP